MKSGKLLLAAMVGSCILAGTAYAGEWKSDQGKWWYLNDDSTYPVDGWMWIDGKCYYFDPDGYCLINGIAPDGSAVDETGAWIVNGVVQMQSQYETKDVWKGAYLADDGQIIVVTGSDEEGVYLTFNGYSEEGWYSNTERLAYRNAEKTQVSSPYYYNGQLIEETVYTLTDTGIQVNVLPAGGWKDGVYIRQ